MWHDLTGQTFNSLRVIGRSKTPLPYSKGSRTWDCLCLRCGKIKQFTTSALIQKRNQACGCVAAPDMMGKKIGKLSVIGKIPSEGEHLGPLWKCLCECGNICYRTTGALLRTDRKRLASCGCELRKYANEDEENIGHRYRMMLRRCYDPKDFYYYNYGGRGIYVCEEWRNNEFAFIDWALSHGFSRDLEIDRIDNNGPYSPDNCRWITRRENSNNKRTNHYVTVRGVKRSVADWAEVLFIPRNECYYLASKYSDEMLGCIFDKIMTANDTVCLVGDIADTVRNHCTCQGISTVQLASFFEIYSVSNLVDRLTYA